jgi:hypothetical protein
MEHRDCDTVLFTISMDRKGYLDKALRGTRRGTIAKVSNFERKY